MRELTGEMAGAGLRVAIVCARWNSFVTRVLCEGAVRELERLEVASDEIEVAWVPGSFEVPIAAKWAAESGRYDAVIGLGAVIRGETAHFDFVAGGAAEGLLHTALDTGVPVVFGVLTTDTVEQANERAGGREGHKGEEAARTAVEMANLRRALGAGSRVPSRGA